MIEEVPLLEYVIRADFYNDGHNWALLATARTGDDIDDDFVSIVYPYSDDYVHTKVHIEELTDYITFCIHDGDLIIGDRHSTMFYIVGFDGNVIGQFNPGLAINQIFSYQSHLFLAGESMVLILNSEYEVVDTTQFTTPLRNSQWYHDKLFTVLENDIASISFEYGSQEFYDIPFEGEIIDYVVERDTMYVLLHNESNYALFTYDLDEGELLKDDYFSYPTLVLDGFLKGYNSIKVFGHQSVFGEKYNFIYPIDDLDAIKSNISLDINRITYRIDTVEGGGYQYPMYHYEMEYTVENKGETVETFQIVSTPLEGINCVYNHVDNGKNVSIPPMTSYTFTEHTTSTRLNNNICLAAYAPNGEPDIDFYDNISCFTPVLSATKAIPKVVASIHPNPVKHTLAIETESNLKTIIVRDMTGTPIGRYGHNHGYTLDVSGLTTGSYLLEIIDMEGRRSVLKFIKVL